ncbi:macrophage mannose receptor 1-like [Scomber japonicus]|uniref:macrophage mannose receptor 1-like n=1 Tax=Scomber japonicus TaxID=13676 RepID=UPI002305825C|nr:macrophage mannose receptor 1-like [Scomber japonicus]
MWVTCTAFVLLIQTLQCLASDDSPFQLTNKATGFCLVKAHDYCLEIRWTTGDRLLVPWRNKCLGVQGKSVGSEISVYDCDENSELQKWECKNGTLLALKGQELYIELTADNTAILSKTIGPNNHLTISGTSSGACTKTYRALYTIGGNAYGQPCMFPFLYKDHWYSDCTKADSRVLWCATQTKYENELWGFCPTNSKTSWAKHSTTGDSYQLNTQSALTWSQAEASCKQQAASLLSITDPNEQAYITALLSQGGRGLGNKLWTGLILDPEHGWQWSNGEPYRYLNWDSGHPLSSPGQLCGIANGEVMYSWQSSLCNKKLGYICYSKGVVARPTTADTRGFCSRPWIPYNNHCFHLNRAKKSWSDAQRECRKEGGDLVSIRNVEDQSFVISQLGYGPTDELWIGMNDRKKEGVFDWSDHSTVRFTSWEYESPSISTDQKDCVLIRGKIGNWADRVCEEKHGFICMKMGDSEPSGDEVDQNLGCKNGWKRHGSYCYSVGTKTKTFDEAKDDCKSSDSYLADISNGVDNAFLVSLVGLRPEKYFWLGLSNQRNIDEFVWTNTDNVRFTHWNAEMPGHQQGCVAMTTGIFAGLWDVLPCTNKEKYICKHLAEGAVLTPAPPTVLPPSCAEGWFPIGPGNKCYKYFTESSRMTWYEARDYCRATGGDLLSIHSEAEIQTIHGHSKVWIGLNIPDPITGYVWSDGSSVNFQHWQDGEPNNQNNAESCAEMHVFMKMWGSTWNDVPCEMYKGFLCQIRAGVTPKTPDTINPDVNITSDGWLEWNGNQYYIQEDRQAMEDARKFCQKRHGDLVSINSEAERVFLWKQKSRRYGTFWIGLNVELDGTYEWMDGSPVVFQKWAEGQPDFKNYDENCAIMNYYTGFWHDYNCGNEYEAICKRSGSTPANTTVAPTVPPKGGCPPQWKKFNSKCYNIISQKVTWDGARKQCQAMGGNLASIPSRHVNVFLMTQMADTPTTDLWIGLHDLYDTGFYWTDGQPRSYYNFEQKCVVLKNSLPGPGKWIKQSCNETNGFVCHRSIDPSFPDSADPLFTDYVKLVNDSMKVVTQNMTWAEAKRHCEGDGAKLVSLKDEWKQAYVELMALNLQAPLWIGLNKMETDGYFRYIDGWPMTFTRWYWGEPRSDRPCVYIDVNGKWKTALCNQTMNSVCMKSTDVPPTESSEFPGVCPEIPSLPFGQNVIWQPFKGYCYIFFPDMKQWPDAAANCIQHGGTLASIEDPAEQTFIQKSLKIFEDSYTSFWIGLYKTKKGAWMWFDKTIMDYTNWGVGGPDYHNYGAISTSNGTWWQRSQYHGRPYICKTPKVLVPKPSPTPTSVIVHHGHVALAVVLTISGIALGAVIAFLLFKKSGRHLPILDNLHAFDNPLFSNTDRSQSDLLDTNKLVENAEEESPQAITTNGLKVSDSNE